jgi:hypothetical protein
MRKADKRVHEGELARVIELKPWNSLPGRCDSRFCKLSQLTAVDKGLQNILLTLR